jgi:hypothetical protein
MEIGEVLSRAWQIIWKHKVLWIFGILASCSSASGSAPNFRGSYQPNLPPEAQRYFYFDQVNQLPGWLIALIVGGVILVVLILIVLAIFLGTVGRVGLIRGTQQLEGGEIRLAFGELFSGSLPYFWRVFGLNLIVGLALAILFGALILFVIFGSILTLGLGALCLVPLICLAVPVGWFINVVVEQANIAIVIENLGIFDGLRRGWEVVRVNLGMIIVMALILMLGVGLLGGFIIGLPFVLIVAPAVLGAIAGTRQALGGGLLVAGLCLVGYIPVAIVLNGILRSYIETAWTLTYLRLTGKAAPSLEPVAPESA